ncbi:assimilatory sulfite reductase (NADPH) hemoprotein subunit [Buchnera aphidicola]|uniref:assimilatory sulfite reductase (NADPH) hemoprotein subunit n=1 Tax=Buchnera aphidicola TaxID=9 RepID=UPI0034641A63
MTKKNCLNENKNCQFTKEEQLKYASNYFRGNIKHELESHGVTNAFSEDSSFLIRFHGMYQQDNRDLRRERFLQKLEPLYSMMIRCRLPGGIITSKQWLEIDNYVKNYTLYGTIRLTNRQTFQIHGILKKNIKSIHKVLYNIQLDSIATANDVNRNVLCSSNPIETMIHKEVYEWTKKLSNHLLPKTNSYFEIWLDQKKISTTENEPILGKTYLPRKFKTALVIPPHNDVDIHANDMSFIAIIRSNKLIGFNVLVGGGLSIDHNNKNTWPSLAKELGFIQSDNILSIAESIITIQRDWGNRSNRKNAKTRYTINNFGFDIFKKEIEKRSCITFKQSYPYIFLNRTDQFGWKQDIYGNWNLILFIPNGRIFNSNNIFLKAGISEIAKIHSKKFIITANQNLVIANISSSEKDRINDIAISYGLIQKYSKIRLSAMSCVSFPTCPLAMAEGERILPFFLDHLEHILIKYNMFSEDIIFRISGCPNGCGRSLLSEIGLIGKSINRYNLYLGGNYIGTRIAKLYLENIDSEEIIKNLDILIHRWSSERNINERFGDFCIRSKIVKEILNPISDFW